MDRSFDGDREFKCLDRPKPLDVFEHVLGVGVLAGTWYETRVLILLLSHGG